LATTVTMTIRSSHPAVTSPFVSDNDASPPRIEHIRIRLEFVRDFVGRPGQFSWYGLSTRVEWSGVRSSVQAKPSVPVHTGPKAHPAPCAMRALPLAVTDSVWSPFCSWCRVLLQKRTGSQLVKKFPAFYGTQRFITTFKRARQVSLS
jgi:hypothetical protein